MIFLLLIFIYLCNAEIDLSSYENKIYSQNGEDGITEKLISLLNITNGYYVEFGVESGNECNTRILREKYKWNGIMMDGRYENINIKLYKEFITKENINTLFQKYKVPDEFDILSIDIDYNDFYVWKEIKNRAKIVIIEYNSNHNIDLDKIVKYHNETTWDGTNYFGASIRSLYNLGKSKGYNLIYSDKNGVNLFFLRDDFEIDIKNKNNLEKIYRKPAYGGHRKDHLNRLYVSSSD